MKKYTLDEVYTADMTAFQRERYNRVADEFEKLFGEKPTAFFSAPGRTEVGGNHTDHNFGCVLAAVSSATKRDFWVEECPKREHLRLAFQQS